MQSKTISVYLNTLMRNNPHHMMHSKCLRSLSLSKGAVFPYIQQICVCVCAFLCLYCCVYMCMCCMSACVFEVNVYSICVINCMTGGLEYWETLRIKELWLFLYQFHHSYLHKHSFIFIRIDECKRNMNMINSLSFFLK